MQPLAAPEERMNRRSVFQLRSFTDGACRKLVKVGKEVIRVAGSNKSIHVSKERLKQVCPISLLRPLQPFVCCQELCNALAFMLPEIACLCVGSAALLVERDYLLVTEVGNNFYPGTSMKIFQEREEGFRRVAIPQGITKQRRRLPEKVHSPEILHNIAKQPCLVSYQLGIVKRTALKGVILQCPKAEAVNGENRSGIEGAESPLKEIAHLFHATLRGLFVQLFKKCVRCLSTLHNLKRLTNTSADSRTKLLRCRLGIGHHKNLLRQQLLLHQQPQIERRNSIGLPRPGACLDEVSAGECDSDVVQLLHYGFASAGWMMGVKAQDIIINDSYLLK